MYFNNILMKDKIILLFRMILFALIEAYFLIKIRQYNSNLNYELI